MKKKVKTKQILIFKTIAAVFFCFALITTFQNCSAINIQDKENASVQNSSVGMTKGEWDLCPKTNFYRGGNDDFYNVRPIPSTQVIGPLGNGTTMVIKFTPNSGPNPNCTGNRCIPLHPSGAQLNAFFSAVYGGGSNVVRDWSISKTACDFSSNGAVTNNQGQKLFGRASGDIRFSYNYGDPGSGATFIYGETYYLNIFGVSDCPVGDCHFGPITWQ